MHRKEFCLEYKEGGKSMTNVGEEYLCEICGNRVNVLESGVGTLVCCGQDMLLQ